MTRSSAGVPAGLAGIEGSAGLTEYSITEYGISVADVGLTADRARLLRYILDSAVALLPGVSDAAVVLFSRADFKGARAVWAEVNPAAGTAGPVLDGRVDAPLGGVRADTFAAPVPASGHGPRLGGEPLEQRLSLIVADENFGQLILAVDPRGERPAADLVTSFAAHSAVAVAAALKLRTLTAALLRRDLIGQAKGILMERFSLDSDGAFAMLRRISMDSNTKLGAVCADLVAGRVRPDPAALVGRAGSPG